MTDWQTLLGVDWPASDSPQSLCDQSGECCRGAAQVLPWQNLLRQAAKGDETARDFMAQFVPYVSQEEARLGAPDAVAASLKIAAERGDTLSDVIFYHCRFLKNKNQCQIYEDRPSLCREFPESPFGSIPACCGYASLTKTCLQKITDLKQELAHYQAQLQQES